MGSGGKKNKTNDTVGTVRIGGRVASTTRTGSGGQSTTINFTPNQQSAYNTADQGLADATGLVRGALAVSPEEQEAYTQALFQPVAGQIRDNYGQARTRAYDRFATIGGLNSVGFNRFNNNVIDTNENRALSDARYQAEIGGYSLPGIKLNPIQQALGIYQGVQGGLINQALGLSDRATQGSLNGLQLQQQSQQGGSNTGSYIASGAGLAASLLPLLL